MIQIYKNYEGHKELEELDHIELESWELYLLRLFYCFMEVEFFFLASFIRCLSNGRD